MNTQMELHKILEKGQEMQKRHPLLAFFSWPVSQPGPYVTPPLSGYIPVRTRPDQEMMVASYYQERGYLKALIGGQVAVSFSG